MSGFIAGIAEHRIDARRVWVSAIALALLQTVIILYLIVSHALVLAHGSEVLLRAAPVDPRDLLRGDYVTLSYDITRVPVSTLVGEKRATDGYRVLHVRLQKQPDGFWNVAESSFKPLPPREGSVLLKSRPFDYRPSIDTEAITVDYGIGSFYVPEGEGRNLEQATNAGRVSIAARIDREGTAQIRSLLLDGKPVYDEPLY